jgi:polysaccharide chain length determinant protein (PEP-CTERM system associated)
MEGLDEIKELVFKYLRGIWKFRWIGVGIAWIVLVAGILVVDQIKNRYTAVTKLYIDSSSILTPLLKGLAVESDLDAAVQLMVRQLLNRPNLERIVRLADLDLEVVDANQMEAIINEIRNRINIALPGKKNNIYTISYSDTDRDRAKRIVQIILDLFVEDTLGKTGSESDTAIEFLDAQIKKYETLLLEAEERREEFKRKNVGLMPKDGASYYGQLQQENLLLEQARLSLAESENRRDQIKLQIAELKSNVSGEEVSAKTSLDLRIEDQEGKVDELLLLYTEEHPDVINARHVLESLKERKQAELSETLNTNQGSIGKNPVYQELQILLAATEADISSYKTRVNSMEKKQRDLKRLIDIVPKIEADLERLNRDYEVHKNNYNQLVERREKAKISEDVEAGGEQVKFRIIEPPFAPQRPDFPDRPLFDAGVLLLALGIGYGVSLLISFFKPVFYNQYDIRNVMTTPILGSIKKFDTPGVLSKRRRNLALFSLINVSLVCVASYLIFLHSKDVVIIDRIKDLALYLGRVKGQVF